ncbi:non-structural maintenance of chromosomes element 3 homolog [Copidosoma floridanum]|uniref:non-structural maintenance of chromosomes element 3 homolog n=1 Tax=Copidosoma floridanum TaxID=29053 RepID=UPI0006C9DA63|nr:non-structural maintenance of chromosomes element 3 homolog [Copidosoma floridanum]XP_014215957.1 non-structural maintenance of chromosomes element 3 homolog [Copidosoma floridanum]
MSSQRSQKRAAKAGPSSSQRPGTSSQFIVEDEEVLPASQISPNKNLTNQEHAHHVSNVVKYILGADHSKIPITKSAISKAVDCHNKNFKSVIDQAIKILKDTFGYEVTDVDGKLFIYNRLKNDIPHIEYDEDVANRHVLLFIILSHIYMSGDRCSQGSLIHFLIRLGIITDESSRSEIFGNILELMTGDFVKEKYLHLEKSENLDTDEPEYSWGMRAELELPRRTVMEFVSMMYRGRNIDSWSQQFEKMLQSEGRLRERANPRATQNGRVEHMEQQ